MKFFVILTATFNDGTTDKKAIYEYDNENDAIANFHSNMASYMKMENVEHVLCMAINSQGGIYKNECFTNLVKVSNAEDTVSEETVSDENVMNEI